MHFVDSSTEISMEGLAQQWQALGQCSLDNIDRGVVVLIDSILPPGTTVVFVHDEASYTRFRQLFEAAEDHCVDSQETLRDRFRMELIAAIDTEEWPGVTQPLLLRSRLAHDVYYSQVVAYLKARRAAHPHLTVIRNTYLCSMTKTPVQSRLGLDALIKKRKKYVPGIKLPALPPGATTANALAMMDVTDMSLSAHLTNSPVKYPSLNLSAI